jgi:tetratricopeptide (TPR) repeat protein
MKDSGEHEEEASAPSTVELVNRYLRAQNLEQVGRLDEAIELYESAVAEGFDSSGPYDRLIAVYAHGGLHRDVIRVARRALDRVHTYEGKRSWYERMVVDAERALANVPKAAPKRPPEDGEAR